MRGTTIVIACLLLGCVSEEPVGLDALVARCESDDVPWREAVQRALQSERTEQAERALAGGGRCESWQVPWARGELRFNLADYDRAAEDLRVALELARETDDPVGVARAGNRLGSIAYYRGEQAASRELFLEALDAANRADRVDLRAFVSNNLSGLLKELGELPRAVELFAQAVESLRELGYEKPARDARYNEGTLLLELGAIQRAEEVLQAVYDESIANDDGETASLAALASANVQLVKGEHSRASAWLDRSTDEAVPTRFATLLSAGRIAAAEGRLGLAEERFVEAAGLAREHEILIDAVIAEARLGDVYRRQRRLDEARTTLDATIAQAEAMQSVQYAAWLGHWFLGRTHRDRGEVAAARASLERAIAIIEEQRRKLSPVDDGMHFLTEKSDPYLELALLLTGEGSESIDLCSELFDVLSRAHTSALERVASRSSTTRVTLSDVQEGLGSDELLIDTLLGPERGVQLIVGNDFARAVPLPGLRELGPDLHAYRAAVTRPLDDVLAAADPMGDLATEIDAGRRVRRTLFDHVPLEGVRRIWFVPDREIALLPLEALPLDDAEFLGDDVEITYLLRAGRPSRERPESGRPLLVAGAPSTSGHYPPLPRARDEIEAVAAIRGEGEVVRSTGDDFTTQALDELDLSRFGTLHLATHAEASTLDPRRCGLVTSSENLYGFDRIARLELDAPLVVLSACRSGAGEPVPGQGMVGMGWAFLVAGARELVASLWRVDDAATAEFMTAFHRRLAEGATTAEALAATRREQREKYPHPVHWAPFVLYANPEAG